MFRSLLPGPGWGNSTCELLPAIHLVLFVFHWFSTDYWSDSLTAFHLTPNPSIPTISFAFICAEPSAGASDLLSAPSIIIITTKAC